MFSMKVKIVPRFLLPLLALFLFASLVHFIHNAEFLTDYPGLPKTWTRGGVYAAWLAMASVAVVGYTLVRSGWRKCGLMLIALASLGGVDSLGHYIVAPAGAHTLAMNATILFEVICAFVLLAYVMKHVFSTRQRAV
jgi:hypothetical protein